jgi:hypothetical protein
MSGNSRIPRSGALTFGYNESSEDRKENDDIIKKIEISNTTFYSPEEATTQDIHYFVCSLHRF